MKLATKVFLSIGLLILGVIALSNILVSGPALFNATVGDNTTVQKLTDYSQDYIQMSEELQQIAQENETYISQLGWIDKGTYYFFNIFGAGAEVLYIKKSIEMQLKGLTMARDVFATAFEGLPIPASVAMVLLAIIGGLFVLSIFER